MRTRIGVSSGQGSSGEGALRIHGRSDRQRRGGEDRKEGVALSADLDAAVVLDGGPDQFVVRGKEWPKRSPRL